MAILSILYILMKIIIITIIFDKIKKLIMLINSVDTYLYFRPIDLKKYIIVL